MFKSKILRISAVLILLLALVLAGCSSSQSTATLITALDGIQVAATVASATIPVLCSSAVIPADLCSVIEAYVAAVGQAAASSATELKSGDTNILKVSAIIDIFAKVIVPVLPSGIDPRVAVYITGIDAAQKSFLALLGPAKTGLTAAPNLAQDVIKPNWLERRHLTQIHDKAIAAAEAVTTKGK
jgi:hypothetical protein